MSAGMADIVVAVRCRYWRRLKQLQSEFASYVEKYDDLSEGMPMARSPATT